MRKWFLIPLLSLIILLAGCGNRQALSGEEAAKLFLDRLIYEKNHEAFVQNFVNGEELAASFDENAVNFQKNFTQQLAALSSDLTDREALELTRSLVKEMDGKTTYTVKKSKSDDSYITATYAVSGLDFAGIIEGTLRELAEESQYNINGFADQEYTNKKIIKTLEDQIEDVGKKKEAVTVTLVLKKKGGKWTVDKNQNQQITELFMAFIAGVKSQDALSIEINDVVAEVMNEYLAEEEEEPDSSTAETDPNEEREPTDETQDLSEESTAESDTEVDESDSATDNIIVQE